MASGDPAHDEGQTGGDEDVAAMAAVGEELTQVVDALGFDQEFQLSPGQASFLKDLCKELGYNYADEASALTSGEEASERLDQLLAERKTKRAAGEVTAPQMAKLRRLGAKPQQLVGLTRLAASELISKLTVQAAERAANEGASPAQLKLLRDLGYKGATVTTKVAAQHAIRLCKAERNAARMFEFATRKGLSGQKLEKLREMLDKARKHLG